MNEWEDKEDAYRDLYQTGRQAKNLWKYIPENKLKGVEYAFSDPDGYWIYLDHEEGGWVAYDGALDCGIIHEYTIADLKAAIKTIRKGK